jgi:hypothetical protein
MRKFVDNGVVRGAYLGSKTAHFLGVLHVGARSLEELHQCFRAAGFSLDNYSLYNHYNLLFFVFLHHPSGKGMDYDF